MKTYLNTMKKNARKAFRGGEAENDDFGEVDIYVYFHMEVPGLSFHEITLQDGYIECAKPEFINSGNNGPYFQVAVQVCAPFFEDFCKGMKQVEGMIGIELSEYSQPAEFTQYDRYCP